MTAPVGDAELLDEAPCAVEIHDEPYILSRNEDGVPVLYDALCPHEGGTVDVESDTCLRCPQHNWDFDPRPGTARTSPVRRYELTQ